jgi:tyrosinase
VNNHLTRRRFLVTAGAAATTVLGSSLFNLDTVLAAPLVRRNLGGMDASDPILVSYRAAINAMKKLDYHNPLSWDYQAAIHGTLRPDNLPQWNMCEHGTPFFWSWHRMYLYWFERIIRKMSGDPCWALPYWDYWSVSQRSLPVPFRDSTSELYESNRGFGWNNGTASFAAYRVDPTSGNAFLDFFSAQSGLEQSPHNHVHVDIGGLMGDPSTAAIDPVFFVHHSNIDRLWNLWLAQGGGRSDPLTTASWRDKTYTFFDENGNAVNMTTCDILRCVEQLKYSYESEPPEVKEYCLRVIPYPIYYLIQEVLVPWPGPPIELVEGEVVATLKVKQLRERLLQLAESKNEVLLLELTDVEAERLPGVGWDVYLGLPPNTAPNPESPFFVGSISLFSAGVRSRQHHKEFRPEHFSFRANRAFAAALKANPGDLRLVFVPTGPLINGKPSRPKPQATIRIGKANVVLGREEQRKENPERPQNEPK